MDQIACGVNSYRICHDGASSEDPMTFVCFAASYCLYSCFDLSVLSYPSTSFGLEAWCCACSYSAEFEIADSNPLGPGSWIPYLDPAFSFARSEISSFILRAYWVTAIKLATIVDFLWPDPKNFKLAMARVSDSKTIEAASLSHLSKELFFD